MVALSLRHALTLSIPAAIDFYVDSVNGSDSNDGTTEDTAFQTLATAKAALSAGKTLALVRGSHWREQLDIPASNISIVSVGTGAIPVIDGADIVTSGWTQPDAVTYPNVWSQSWTRSSATTTGSEQLGYWEAGVRTTQQADLAALQAGSNGDWHTTAPTLQTSTVSIRSAADPNSDGILREFTKRHYGINSHSTTNAAGPTNTTVAGPIELKRCVGHYNALPMGTGTASKLLLRDGNIHHSVSEGNQTDVLATEYSPEVATSAWAFYNSSAPASFNPVATRLGAILPGGASRVDGVSAFYAHGSATIASFTLNGCFSRGCDFVNADTELLTVTGGYCVDAPYKGVSFGGNDNQISYMLINETTTSPFTSSNAAFYMAGIAASADNTVTVQHSCAHIKKGTGVFHSGGAGASWTNCSFATPGAVFDWNSNTENLTINNCVFQGVGRSYTNFTTGTYTGDFNVFYWAGTAAPQFNMSGSTYSDLATWQAASGQDANSVFLKAADQVSGNGIAFWKGLADGTSTGPADGDWRINPNAKVYGGDGTAYTGTFADGTTAITEAGAQFHWDFNARATAAGPPSAYPTLPATVAEMRTYLEDPTSWDFYP